MFKQRANDPSPKQGMSMYVPNPVSKTSYPGVKPQKRSNQSQAHNSPQASQPAVAAVHSATAFQWNNANKRAEFAFLFIAHDNPQLSNTVKKSMEILIETKDDKEITYFISGNVAYNGSIEGVEDSELFDPRGSQFLVCYQLRGIKANVKKFPTRANGDISEIEISGLPADCYFNLSTVEEIKSFFQPCKSRVDVILNPSHSQNWYPYWEGTRKMAPQFRSSGVGYIRLGDDMSQYGVAFLSLDAGHTFLDNGAASIVSGSTGPPSFNSSLNSNSGVQIPIIDNKGLAIEGSKRSNLNSINTSKGQDAAHISTLAQLQFQQYNPDGLASPHRPPRIGTIRSSSAVDGYGVKKSLEAAAIKTSSYSHPDVLQTVQNANSSGYENAELYGNENSFDTRTDDVVYSRNINRVNEQFGKPSHQLHGGRSKVRSDSVSSSAATSGSASSMSTPYTPASTITGDLFLYPASIPAATNGPPSGCYDEGVSNLRMSGDYSDLAAIMSDSSASNTANNLRKNAVSNTLSGTRSKSKPRPPAVPVTISASPPGRAITMTSSLPSAGARSPTPTSTINGAATSAVLSIRDNNLVRGWLLIIRTDDTKQFKWVDRVSALNQLSDYLKLHSSSSSSDRISAAILPADTIEEIVQSLTDSFLKQNNPNVIRSCLQCASCLSCITNSVSMSSCQKVLVLEIIHLLRSSNRTLADSSRSCLDAFVQNGFRISHIVISNIASDVLYGPRSKSSTTSVASGASASRTVHTIAAANSHKVLVWLISLAIIEMNEKIIKIKQLIRSDGILSTCNSGSDAEPALVMLALLVSVNNPLLAHRDVDTRDSAMEFVSLLLIWDSIQQLSKLKDSDGFDFRKKEFSIIKSRLDKTGGITSSQFLSAQANPVVLEASGLFLKSLHADVLQLLTEMEKGSSKLFYKLLSQSLSQLPVYIVALNTDAPKVSSNSLRSSIDSSAHDMVPTSNNQQISASVNLKSNLIQQLLTEPVASANVNYNPTTSDPARSSRVRRVGNRSRVGNFYDNNPNSRNCLLSQFDTPIGEIPSHRMSTAPCEPVTTPTDPSTLRPDASAPALLTATQVNLLSSGDMTDAIGAQNMIPNPYADNFFNVDSLNDEYNKNQSSRAAIFDYSDKCDTSAFADFPSRFESLNRHKTTKVDHEPTSELEVDHLNCSGSNKVPSTFSFGHDYSSTSPCIKNHLDLNQPWDSESVKALLDEGSNIKAQTWHPHSTENISSALLRHDSSTNVAVKTSVSSGSTPRQRGNSCMDEQKPVNSINRSSSTAQVPMLPVITTTSFTDISLGPSSTNSAMNRDTSFTGTIVGLTERSPRSAMESSRDHLGLGLAPTTERSLHSAGDAGYVKHFNSISKLISPPNLSTNSNANTLSQSLLPSTVSSNISSNPTIIEPDRFAVMRRSVVGPCNAQSNSTVTTENSDILITAQMGGSTSLYTPKLSDLSNSFFNSSSADDNNYQTTSRKPDKLIDKLLGQSPSAVLDPCRHRQSQSFLNDGNTSVIAPPSSSSSTTTTRNDYHTTAAVDTLFVSTDPVCGDPAYTACEYSKPTLTLDQLKTKLKKRWSALRLFVKGPYPTDQSSWLELVQIVDGVSSLVSETKYLAALYSVPVTQLLLNMLRGSAVRSSNAMTLGSLGSSHRTDWKQTAGGLDIELSIILERSTLLVADSRYEGLRGRWLRADERLRLPLTQAESDSQGDQRNRKETSNGWGNRDEQQHHNLDTFASGNLDSSIGSSCSADLDTFALLSRRFSSCVADTRRIRENWFSFL